MSVGAAAEKQRLAARMRAAPTRAEATLWEGLRRRALGGWKFRRQHVIAGFIVDFYCPQLRLAVEVDGGVHGDRREQDAERDQHLERLGVQVVRVDNDEVLQRLDAVVVMLAACCERAATADPPLLTSPRPAGGGA